MTVKELFDFIIDTNITAANMDSYLDYAMEKASQRTVQEVTEQEKVDEEVSDAIFNLLTPSLITRVRNAVLINVFVLTGVQERLHSSYTR